MGSLSRSLVPLLKGLDGMREGFQIVDHDWRYLYLNQSACLQSQLECDDLVGRTMMEVFPGIEDSELFRELERCRREGISHSMENEFALPDGTHRWFDLRISPVPEGLVILSVDITQQKLFERQVHESQRLEAVGRLAGGIAHDFNNLITAINGLVTFARRRLDKGGCPLAELDGINDATRRAEELSRHLLEFARKRPVRPALLNVNYTLHATDLILRRLVGPEVEVEVRAADDLWSVFMDGGALEQALLNLAANARDAMAGGGRLVIATSNASLDEAYAMGKQGEVPPGDYVMIEVSDSGCGMPREVQERAFEPFFTTKAEGTGTGLGLATCFGIVKQAGGHIWLYSEPGMGTTFRIYLPRREGLSAATPLPSRKPAKPSPRIAGGHETVLVVEDDAQVRAVALRALTQHGYHVLEASSPDEAESIARSTEHIDLLVTDVILPGRNGAELAEWAQAAHPEMRVLFVSGYGEDTLARGPRPTGRLLQKPFGLSTLARAVREVLDAGPAPS